MTKIKSSAIRLLLLVAFAASLTFVSVATVSAQGSENSGTGGNTPSSQTPTETEKTGGAKCTGDATACVCPEGADTTCGTDPVFKQCKKQVLTETQKSYKECQLKNDLFARYVNPIIATLSALVGIAVAAGIIWGGIQYAMSAGDPQKAAAAKNHIRNSIIGLIAFLFLFALIRFLVPGGENLTN